MLVHKIFPIVEQESDNYSLHPNEGDDLFRALKVPLTIGALLGLIPIQGIWRNGVQKFS